MTLLQDIISGAVEFSPAGLLRAVKKARKQLQDTQAKDQNDGGPSGDEHEDVVDDDDADDASATTSAKKAKKKRLPPFQPAFARLVDDIQSALSADDLPALRSSVAILMNLAPLIKVNKQKGSDGASLDAGTEQYVRDAHRLAKEAVKKRDVAQDSDQSSSSDPSVHDDLEEID